MAEPGRFERFERTFNLQLELLKAIGDFEKKQAEIAMLNAQTLNVLERNRTLAIINKRIVFVFNELHKQQKKIEAKQKKMQIFPFE